MEKNDIYNIQHIDNIVNQLKSKSYIEIENEQELLEELKNVESIKNTIDNIDFKITENIDKLIQNIEENKRTIEKYKDDIKQLIQSVNSVNETINTAFNDYKIIYENMLSNFEKIDNDVINALQTNSKNISELFKILISSQEEIIKSYKSITTYLNNLTTMINEQNTNINKKIDKTIEEHKTYYYLLSTEIKENKTKIKNIEETLQKTIKKNRTYFILLIVIEIFILLLTFIKH